MRTRIEQSTPTSWLVFVEYVPDPKKLSKSEKSSEWIYVGNWGSEAAAIAACDWFRER